MGIFYSEVFTRLIVMSPSIWWDDYAIFRLVGILGEKPPLKIWLDTGTSEPGWELTRELLNHLIEKGWKLRSRSELSRSSTAPITAKPPGQRGLNRRCGSCFRQQNRILTFPAVEPADSAAMVPAAAWGLVESALAVMEFLAFGYPSQTNRFYCNHFP